MLTEEQEAQRQLGIGSSDIATACGIDPWGTPIDLYLEKPGPERPPVKVEPDEDEDGTEASEIGHLMEPVILELYQRRTGRKAESWQETLHHESSDWAMATPDGCVVGEERGIEFKHVGFRVAPRWWEGKDPIQVPDYVRAQIEWQMFVTGYPRWDVACLIGSEFEVFEPEGDEELQETMFNIGENFWFNHVQVNEPPAVLPKEDYLEYMRKRFPNSDALLANDRDVLSTDECDELEQWIGAYMHVKAIEKKAEADMKTIKGNIARFIGFRQGLKGRWGKVTWKDQRGRVSWKKLAQAFSIGAETVRDITPGLEDEYRGGSNRVMRISGPPKKKRG